MAAVIPGAAAKPSGTGAHNRLPPSPSAFSIARKACRPVSSASQKASTPEPIGDTTPMPVTATWFIERWRLVLSWNARACGLERCGLRDECSPRRIVPPGDRLHDQGPLAHGPADADVIVERAQEAQVDEGLTHSHTAEQEAIDTLGQPGIDDPQPVLERIGLQSEQTHERVRHGGRGPGLGAACHRIPDRMALIRATLQAGIELWEPMPPKASGRILQRRKQPLRLGIATVTPEAGEDQRIVVRPDAAQLVAERVVALLPGGERADAPAAEHV